VNTLRHKSFRLTHSSSNTTLSGVGYYAPAARTTLNPYVFLCSSLRSLTSKTLKPLHILGLRAGALRHLARDFPLRHLARQVGGLGIRFLLVFSLSMMVQIVEHRAETSVDFMVEEEATSSTPQVPNCPVPGTALYTPYGSIQLHRHPGLRRGRLQERCQQPGSCCDTLQAPRPRQGP
jgi:hypothetical protein